MLKLLLTFVFSFSVFFNMAILAQTPGNALNLDGSNDFVVSSTMPPMFSSPGTSDFTIEAWVYPVGNIFSRIIFAQPSTSNFVSMGTGTGNVIYFYVIANGTTYSRVTTGGIPQNQWTHVACRWTATTVTPEVFFNGVLQAAIAGGTSSTGTNGLMTIGTRPGGGTQYFNGSLDDIRIWSEARTNCQIQSNMNSEYVSPQPNLQAYYNFNQGTAGASNGAFTTLPDMNAAYNGTLTNFALIGTVSNWIASGAVINAVGPSVFTASVSNTICSGDSVSLGGIWLTATGVYYDTISTVACDSAFIYNLTVLPPVINTVDVTACDQYTFNAALLTVSGTYQDTLSSASGCDSIVTLNLTIHNSQNASLNETACDSYMFNSILLTASGIYYDTLNTSFGCDSIISLDLTIHPSQSNTITETACNQYMFGGLLLTASGNYYDTLVTATGCDSIVHLDLTIDTVNTGVTVASPTLTASASVAVYQWLNCDNGFAVVTGETGQSYTAPVTGNYAVAITQNGCTDTSACYLINVLGVAETDAWPLRIYPNPAKNFFRIEWGMNMEEITVAVLDETGRTVIRKNYSGTAYAVMDVESLAPGMYMVTVEVPGQPAKVKKFMKE